ncbi:HNH endonuclease [Azotobacter salinestris]|uniref:HNH endonuclease n=1 Tax=Azotobacter salinestris TaxID=69964 RepID=UPI001266CE34|nr:HNH endonuclease [Azotobacter salinestris]
MEAVTAPAELKFEIGKIYHRQKDLHPQFGGSWQSGIASSAQAPVVFLFTGDSGEQYGYRDALDEHGVFSYTGEGQIGDMTLTGGNAAITNHAANGKALHLFKALGKGKGQQYMGEFACAGYSWARGPDREGNDRNVIVFRLVPVDRVVEEALPGEAESLPKPTSLSEARHLAIQAASASTEVEPGSSVRRLYRRSEQVREYVLMRANGICESCRKPAPFKRKDGSPYLEPHHINRLSDGGLDHPQYIGAICPSCHREIHHGAHGKTKNEELRAYVEAAEKEASA